MTNVQLTVVILTTVLSSIGLLIAVLSFGWRVYTKIDSKIEKLADAHYKLANEFSELRGGLLERFRVRANEQLIADIDEKISQGKPQ